MKHRGRLFTTKDIDSTKASDETFTGAMRSNLAFHMSNCPEYKAILERMNFSLSSLRGIDDLHKIPPLPTSYLKNNSLLSKPYERLLIKTTSSGTGGAKTLSGFDFSSGLYGLFMLLSVFRFHGLLSCKPANYIILGYQPDKSNQTAMAKALKGVTLLAPPKEVVYALTFKNGSYHVNSEGMLDAINRFGRQNRAVRIIGLPAYFKMLLDELRERSLGFKLHKDSRILLGGGWKTLLAGEISKDELFQMANQTLGISLRGFKDHFSTAEHPINYVSCENHHFHVPVFSRVIIRDVITLEPVPYGTPGILNLVTPLLSSAPFGSILTDDIAVLKDGGECGCGIDSPYFEPLGRVGINGLKTCAQAASEFLDKL
jgi:phenylacetate-coenzyme A ligase PaaK-like adenylate-forming protein